MEFRRALNLYCATLDLHPNLIGGISADFDSDGFVTQADLDAWLGQYGSSRQTLSAVCVVPESSRLELLGFSLLTCVMRFPMAQESRRK